MLAKTQPRSKKNNELKVLPITFAAIDSYEKKILGDFVANSYFLDKNLVKYFSFNQDLMQFSELKFLRIF